MDHKIIAMSFGQVIVGPPGSGKTTYCRGMQEFLRTLGRNVSVVNLDPANVNLEYDCCADISELIKVHDVMEELDLGPNGAMVYCLEFLETNIDWLIGVLRTQLSLAPFSYLIFDLPGQIELSTHHESVRNVMRILQKKLDLRLTAVNLVDAHHCTDPSKYISAVFLSLSTMLRLELPHVNVLSKIDLIESQGSLHFNLDFYTDVMDLNYLIPLLPNASKSDETIQRPMTKFEEKFQKLNVAITDLIENYSLVAFKTLNIQDKASVAALVKQIDKSNGFSEVIGAQEYLQSDEYDIQDIQEKYMNN